MWKNWEGEVPTTVSETISKHEVSEDDYPNINTILTIVATLPVTGIQILTALRGTVKIIGPR